MRWPEDYINQIVEGDYLNEIVGCVREFAGGKSLVSQLMKVDAAQLRDNKDYRFEVPFKSFIEKIKRHHGRVYKIDAQTASALEKKIVANKSSGMADLLLLQELLGFPEQELFDVQGNVYRQIAMNLQQNLTTIEQVRQAVVGGRVRTMMAKQ